MKEEGEVRRTSRLLVFLREELFAKRASENATLHNTVPVSQQGGVKLNSCFIVEVSRERYEADCFIESLNNSGSKSLLSAFL
jgi:hypothetical protein